MTWYYSERSNRKIVHDNLVLGPKGHLHQLTRSSEIHILIYFDLTSRFLTYALHEMKILLVLKWNSTALPSGLNVKSTF